MSITATQPIIKIGTSKGITIPAKALKQLDIKEGDKVDVIVTKHSESASDGEVLKAARDILDQYRSDFENLANR